MTPPDEARAALARALPRAVNFRVPLALPVRSDTWPEIAADLVTGLAASGWVVVPEAEWERLRAVEAAARVRETAEEAWADANEAYNTSQDPTVDRRFLQLDRLETERAEAVLALRAALTPALATEPDRETTP